MIFHQDRLRDFDQLVLSRSMILETLRAVCVLGEPLGGWSLTGHIQNSALPLNTEPLSLSRPLTLHLCPSPPDVPPPRFQYAASSFIFQKIPFTFSVHFTDIFSSLFSLFLRPPPFPHLLPFAVSFPPKQSSLCLSLFIYMTQRFSRRQVQIAKGRLFTKRFRF